MTTYQKYTNGFRKGTMSAGFKRLLRNTILYRTWMSIFASIFADKSAPGGYIHRNNFILIDLDKQIRGVWDGTNPTETEKLIKNL